MRFAIAILALPLLTWGGAPPASVAFAQAKQPIASQGLALDISSAALVKGPQVTLGEIATVHCADANLAAKVQATIIGSAPMPGRSRKLDATSIKVRLRQHGLDPGAIACEWPEAVLVTTRATVIAGADLVAAGKQALEPPAAGDEVIATCSRAPADMVLPEGKVEVKAELLGSVAGSSRLVKVTAWVDGQPRASQTICYRLQRFGEVLVARKPIDRGQPIKEDAVALQRREITIGGADEPCDRTADLLGLRARRTLRPGDILTLSAVEKAPAIKRGEKARVTVICGAIRISAEAIACADAAAGSTVRLKSAYSDETFVAQIDEEGRIFVTP